MSTIDGEPGSLLTTEDLVDPEPRPGVAPQPYLFVVLHCDRPLLGGARYAISDIDVVTFSRGAVRAATRRREGELRRLDIHLPGNTVSSRHARLIRGAQGWVLEDTRSKNGTFRNGERVARAKLRDGDLLEIGAVLLRYRAGLPGAGASDLDSAALPSPALGLATLMPRLAEQLAPLLHIAGVPVSVLLLGETGTGKEVLARAIHAQSRRPGPFVAINCGGLPGSLLEGQLFGHVKGSFTGALRDEPGTFRSANHGTLLLDEVGDLPFPAQATLLRVLQEREVVPVGGTRPVKVDLRVIAATHRALEQMVFRGEFRGDLLARLSGYRHLLTPLRGRIEDLGLLAGALLQRSEVPSARDARFTPGAGRRLMRHTWPGNIRELEQILTVAVALADGGVIEPAHLMLEPVEDALALPAPTRSGAPSDPEAMCIPSSRAHGAYQGGSGARGDPEGLCRYLIALLEKHRGNVVYVARDMGKARMQIHRWMERFGINPNDYRG